MANLLVKKYITDCLNIVAEFGTVSPGEFDDVDDFVEAYLEDARRPAVYGPMNAALLSAVEKMAREYWENYHNLD